MRGFELGGVVSGLRKAMAIPTGIPAFAGGGLNVSSSTDSAARNDVTIVFEGHKVTGLAASNKVVNELKQASILYRNSALGPKPGWYK